MSQVPASAAGPPGPDPDPAVARAGLGRQDDAGPTRQAGRRPRRPRSRSRGGSSLRSGRRRSGGRTTRAADYPRSGSPLVQRSVLTAVDLAGVTAPTAPTNASSLGRSDHHQHDRPDRHRHRPGPGDDPDAGHNPNPLPNTIRATLIYYRTADHATVGHQPVPRHGVAPTRATSSGSARTPGLPQQRLRRRNGPTGAFEGFHYLATTSDGQQILLRSSAMQGTTTPAPARRGGRDRDRPGGQPRVAANGLCSPGAPTSRGSCRWPRDDHRPTRSRRFNSSTRRCTSTPSPGSRSGCSRRPSGDDGGDRSAAAGGSRRDPSAVRPRRSMIGGRRRRSGTVQLHVERHVDTYLVTHGKLASVTAVSYRVRRRERPRRRSSSLSCPLALVVGPLVVPVAGFAPVARSMRRVRCRGRSVSVAGCRARWTSAPACSRCRCRWCRSPVRAQRGCRGRCCGTRVGRSMAWIGRGSGRVGRWGCRSSRRRGRSGVPGQRRRVPGGGTYASSLEDYPLQDVAFRRGAGSTRSSWRMTMAGSTVSMSNGNLVSRVDRFGNQTTFTWVAKPGRVGAVVDHRWLWVDDELRVLGQSDHGDRPGPFGRHARRDDDHVGRVGGVDGAGSVRGDGVVRVLAGGRLDGRAVDDDHVDDAGQDPHPVPGRRPVGLGGRGIGGDDRCVETTCWARCGCSR